MSSRSKTLCVIPARAGSVSVKKKNLRKIHNIPLVGWAAKTASVVSEITVIVVSTDSHAIASQAIRFGAHFLGFRSADLSGPKVHDQQVLIESLTQAEERFGTCFDTVMMLQPTSPLRTVGEIQKCLSKVRKSGYTSCWTVSPIDLKYHFRKQLITNDSDFLQLAVDGPRVVARQELSQTFMRNGACYVYSRETIFHDPNLLGDKATFIVSEGCRPNIDTLQDLLWARRISYTDPKSGLLLEKRSNTRV